MGKKRKDLGNFWDWSVRPLAIHAEFRTLSPLHREARSQHRLDHGAAVGEWLDSVLGIREPNVNNLKGPRNLLFTRMLLH